MFCACYEIWKEEGFIWVWPTVLQPNPSVAIYCLGGKQWGNEEQMGFCKWRFDTWSIGIHEGGGSRAHCSSVTVLHPPPPKAPGLWQSPLTHSHLLVPRPDIVALLQPRLVNPKTRFSSMSRIVFVLALAGIWGGVRSTDNAQNINTSIRAQAEPAIIIPFWWPVGDLFFVVIYSAAAHPCLHIQPGISMKNEPVAQRPQQSVNPILTKNLNIGLHLIIIFIIFR